jgi:hypothetical protein
MKSLTRRQLLFQAGGGMSGLALAYLLDQDGLLGEQGPYAPKRPDHPAEPRVLSRCS